MLSILFLALILAGLSSALVSTSLHRQGSARALHEQRRAYERASTGIAVALFELRANDDIGADGIGNASGTIGGGTYAATITPAFAGPGRYTLQSFGDYGPASDGIEFVVSTVSTLDYGLFGRDGITMSGSFSVDSYDSSIGSYASQFGVDHAGDQGHVASNGDIDAGGGIVYGNATPGPGFDVLNPSNVTGSTAPATSPNVPDPYVYAPPIAASGDWSGSGTITAGTYRYGMLTLSGGSVLTIDGDVTLYVDGKFTASGSSSVVLTAGARLTVHHGAEDFTVSGGGIVNPDQRPGDVSIWSASVTKITLSGGSDYHGLVYAPDAQFVSSGGSELYGAIVARSATLSGDGRLHFDTSLSAGGGGGGNFVVEAARRVVRP